MRALKWFTNDWRQSWDVIWHALKEDDTRSLCGTVPYLGTESLTFKFEPKKELMCLSCDDLTMQYYGDW